LALALFLVGRPRFLAGSLAFALLAGSLAFALLAATALFSAESKRMANAAGVIFRHSARYCPRAGQVFAGLVSPAMFPPF